MKTLKISLGVVLVAVSALAQDDPAPQRLQPVRGTGYGYTMHVGGNEVGFWVWDKDLDDSPEWSDPETTPVPFTVADAIRVSRPEVSRYVERPEEWSVSSITLRRSDGRPHWFYVVEWRPRIGEHVGDGLSIPVLMNGKAVVGEVRREAKVR